MLTDIEIENRRLALSLAASQTTTEMVGPTIHRAKKYLEFLEPAESPRDARLLGAVHQVVDALVERLGKDHELALSVSAHGRVKAIAQELKSQIAVRQ